MSKGKWVCAVAAGLLLLIGVPPKARADDASLGAVGYGVVPLDNGQVTMVAERVEAEIRGEEAWVTCVFTFTNAGPAAEVLMGFPQAQASSEGEAPELIDFQAFADGEQLAVSYKVDARQEERTFAGWHTFAVPFAAEQTRTVRNTYHGRLAFHADGGRAFEYVLHTGATWRGPIGQVDVVVRWAKDRDVAPGTLSAKPSGYLRGQRELRWQFSNLEPSPDEDIWVCFRPVYGPHNMGAESIYWGRFPASRTRLGKPLVPLVADADPATAWMSLLGERKPTLAWGYGGFPHYATPTWGVGILPGVARSEGSFRDHGRPKEVRVYLAYPDEDAERLPVISPSPLGPFDLRPNCGYSIVAHTLLLEDAPRWQFLLLEEPATVLAFWLVVESVYPGEARDDVAISEIRFPVLDEDLGSTPALLPITGAGESTDDRGLFWLAACAACVLAVWIRSRSSGKSGRGWR